MCDKPSYWHTQRTPLARLFYLCAATYFVVTWIKQSDPQVFWLFPAVGVLLIVLAASFHHLTVEDQGDRLLIRFSPIPLFRRTVRYDDIEKVEIGRTLFLDGLGIHYSIRGGWVWNLWGRDCVVVHFKKRTSRIGTDDAEDLAWFLEGKIKERGM